MVWQWSEFGWYLFNGDDLLVIECCWFNDDLVLADDDKVILFGDVLDSDVWF